MSRRYRQHDPLIDVEFVDVDSRLSNLEGGDAVPIGTMLLWSGAIPPDNYLWCDGKSYSIDTFPELFKVLERRGGTPSPNSLINFKIPDLTVSSFRFVIKARR